MINNEHDVQNEPTVTFEDTNKSYKQKASGGFPTGAKVALTIIAFALIISIVFAVCLLAFIGVCGFVVILMGIAFLGGIVLGAYLYENGHIDSSWFRAIDLN
jgi:uncharacterized membrane protein